MKKTILFLAAFAALVSCVKENPVTENPADETPSIETCSISLEASAPASSDAEDTKTTLVDDKLVHWTNGDAIKVLFFPRRDEATDNTTRSINGASGELTSTFAGETSPSARFETSSWSWGDGYDFMNTGIALYPSTVNASSSKANGYAGALTNDISYALPSLQTAAENTFQSGINFAYAEISSKSDFKDSKAVLSFKNACALIKITLPEEVKDVTSIEVKSANSYLTGTYAVNSYDGYKPNYPLGMSATEGNASVTLSAEEGQTLKGGVAYYMVVWPGTHSGLMFTFTNTANLKATKLVDKNVTLEAAKYNSYKIKNDLSFEAAVGDYYFADGTTGDDPTAGEVVGVVFYKGDPSVAMNDTDLSGKYTNGLAISLTDVNTTWGGSSQLSGFPSSVFLPFAGPTTYATGGYTTKNIWTGARFTLPIYNYDNNISGTSGWYIPAVVEWKYIYENLSTINSYLKEAQGTEIVISAQNSLWYWLPLIYNSSSYYYPPFMVGLNGTSLSFQKNGFHYHWSSTAKSRPIFAF